MCVYSRVRSLTRCILFVRPFDTNCLCEFHRTSHFIVSAVFFLFIHSFVRFAVEWYFKAYAVSTATALYCCCDYYVCCAKCYHIHIWNSMAHPHILDKSISGIEYMWKIDENFFFVTIDSVYQSTLHKVISDERSFEKRFMLFSQSIEINVLFYKIKCAYEHPPARIR